MERGKFIVIYGANNIGKSTQVKILAKKLRNAGKRVKVIKYPIYDLEPTGPTLNSYLREGLELNELQAQKYYAQNRRDFEPELRGVLESGTWIVAEDYKGTGICWGVVHGVNLDELIRLNSDLLDEDLAILLDSPKQFRESVEKGHHNEDSGVWDKGRDIHLKVGKRFDWKLIKADRKKDKVSQDIWNIIERLL